LSAHAESDVEDNAKTGTDNETESVAVAVAVAGDGTDDFVMYCIAWYYVRAGVDTLLYWYWYWLRLLRCCIILWCAS
jgi:hypothetical protein